MSLHMRLVYFAFSWFWIMIMISWWTDEHVVILSDLANFTISVQLILITSSGFFPNQFILKIIQKLKIKNKYTITVLYGYYTCTCWSMQYFMVIIHVHTDQCRGRPWGTCLLVCSVSVLAPSTSHRLGHSAVHRGQTMPGTAWASVWAVAALWTTPPL